MAIAKFMQEGKSININGGTAGYHAGDIVVFGGGTAGSFCGITKLDIAPGELGAVALEGVYEVAKESPADTCVAGQKIYALNGKAGTSSGAFLGYAVKAATSSDTTITVLLGR